MEFGDLTNAFWRVDQNLASWFFGDLEFGELAFWRLGIWRVGFLASWFFGELTITLFINPAALLLSEVW